MAIFLSKYSRRNQRDDASTSKHREAVARSLRELEKLFSKPKPEKQNTRREPGAGETAKQTNLRANNITQRKANQDEIGKLKKQCLRNITKADKLILNLEQQQSGAKS